MFRKNVVAIWTCQTRPSSRMGQSLSGVFGFGTGLSNANDDCNPCERCFAFFKIFRSRKYTNCSSTHLNLEKNNMESGMAFAIFKLDEIRPNWIKWSHLNFAKMHMANMHYVGVFVFDTVLSSWNTLCPWSIKCKATYQYKCGNWSYNLVRVDGN